METGEDHNVGAMPPLPLLDGEDPSQRDTVLTADGPNTGDVEVLASLPELGTSSAEEGTDKPSDMPALPALQKMPASEMTTAGNSSPTPSLSAVEQAYQVLDESGPPKDMPQLPNLDQSALLPPGNVDATDQQGPEESQRLSVLLPGGDEDQPAGHLVHASVDLPGLGKADR